VKEKFTTNPQEVSDLSWGWLLSHTMRRNTAKKTGKLNRQKAFMALLGVTRRLL
jgi:hypothetical protein